MVDFVCSDDYTFAKGRSHDFLEVELGPAVVGVIVSAVRLSPTRIQEDYICQQSRVVVFLSDLAVCQRVALSV